MTLLDLIIIFWNVVYHLVLWLWPTVACFGALYFIFVAVNAWQQEREAALRKIIREELDRPPGTT